jgi:hypothetical protein
MPAAALAIALVCVGGGTAVKPDSATVSGSTSGTYDYGKGQYSGSYNGQVTGTRSQRYSEQVDVELADNGGRIRLPGPYCPSCMGAMVAGLNSRTCPSRTA